MYPPTPLVWPFLIACLLNTGLAILAWRRRSLLAPRYLFMLAVGAAFWAGAAAFTHWVDSSALKVFGTHVRYVPISLMPVLWLLFTAAYAGVEHRISTSLTAVMLIIPLASMLATATNDYHGLMFTRTWLEFGKSIPIVAHEYGKWFWVNTINAYLLVGAGIALIAYRVRSAAPVFRGQGLVMVAGALAPIAANAVYLSSPESLGYLDPTPVAFGISTLFFGIGVLRFNLFDILPVAREQVLDNVTEGFVVLDMEGRVMDANAIAQATLAIEDGKLQGRFASETPGLLATAWSSLLSDTPQDTLRVGDRWIEWSIRKIETGRVAGGVFGRGWLVLMRDITNHHEAELSLAEARDHAEELSALKSAFLSNLHHELRTPLAGIIGLSDVLDEELEGEPREFVRMIRDSGDRLMTTLDSLLAVAELDAGRVVPEVDRMDVIAETGTVVARARMMAAKKGLEVKFRPPSDTCLAAADSRHYGEIMRHLLDNAIKYTDDGVVTVSVAAEECEIVVSVNDTGCGMSQEFVEKAFEPFRQEDSGLNRRNTGTGLGLRVARGLAERMNARVEVESTPGAGSTFHVVLPAWSEREESPDQGVQPKPGPSAGNRTPSRSRTAPVVGSSMRSKWPSRSQ